MDRRTYHREYMRQYMRQFPWMKNLELARRRCNNPNHEKYPWYGGKGIKCLLTKEEIKELWFRDKASQMIRPSIDRKNNDGHYDFLNSRFIEFARNTAERNKRVLSISINQYDLHGEFIKAWLGAREAERRLNINQSNIIKCCKNKAKTAGGFRWTYAR